MPKCFTFCFMRVGNIFFIWAYSPWADDQGYSHYIIKTPYFIHVTFSSWFTNIWHYEICNPPWLLWFIGFKHPLALLNRKGPSASSLLLALLQCMVHHSQVLPNPSSTYHHGSHISLHHPLAHTWYSPSCYIDVCCDMSWCFWYDHMSQVTNICIWWQFQ